MANITLELLLTLMNANVKLWHCGIQIPFFANGQYKMRIPSSIK